MSGHLNLLKNPSGNIIPSLCDSEGNQNVNVLVEKLGEEGNLWSSNVTTVNSTSSIIDISEHQDITILGSASSSSNGITVQYSADNIAWYDVITLIPIGSGFYTADRTAAKYARIKSLDNSTVTATLMKM